MSAKRELIKNLYRILFKYDENARLNLFQAFPAIKRFFVERRNLLYIRTFGDISFVLLIVMGIFGPQEPHKNAMLFLSWGIWWTSVVLSWFFVGKLWCAFCPFPGLGRLLQGAGLTLNLKVPTFFQKYCTYLSVILLAIIIYIEAVTDMKTWPAGTAYLLLSIILGATFSGLIFSGQSWCRHLCPMGKMIGVASTISMSEFRPDRTVCKTCKTFSCKKGRDGIPGCPVYLGAYNVRNNLYCLVCGRCITLCESDSPRINIRNPFIELIINKGRHLTCSYVIPFLMGSQIARFIQHKAWYNDIVAIFFSSKWLTFSILLLLCFVFFVILTRFGSRLFGLREDEVFGRFSPMVPVLVPLAFTGELVYRLEYFLTNLGDFLPTLGRQFGFDLSHLYFSVPPTVVNFTCLLLLIVGVLSCSYVLHRFNVGDFEGLIKKGNLILLQIIVLFVFAGYAVFYY